MGEISSFVPYSSEVGDVQMWIYELELECHEKVFFASREIDKFFMTESVVGNYALAYAFNFAQSPYHVESVAKDKPRYREDLSVLNEQGIYLTPATPLHKPMLEVERFNALTDSYWYQMSNNIVVGDLTYKLDSSIKRRPANFPQEGRLRLLSRGNRFLTYLQTAEKIDIPSYIRLGKFNSKVKVLVREIWETPPTSEQQEVLIDYYLNPLDIPASCHVTIFDLLSIPPVPLVKNAVMTGEFYHLGSDKLLPVGLKYGGMST